MTRKSSFQLRILRLQNRNWQCGRGCSHPGPAPFPSHCPLQCARKELHIHIWGRPRLHTRASVTSPQKLLLSQLSTVGYTFALRWLYLGGKNFEHLVNQPLIIWARKPGSQVPRACSRMELGCSVQKSMCCWSCGPSTP